MKKNSILLILLIFSITLSSQSERKIFDCENIKKSDLLTCYNRYKEKCGLELCLKNDDGSKGKDMMKHMIEQFDYQALGQLCMNVWYTYYKEGADYTYDTL